MRFDAPGENPIEVDELDLIPIDPLPSYVWYQDMVDFAEGISDRTAGERLSRSLEGKRAFRRFKNELYQRHPELIPAWHAIRDARARARASRSASIPASMPLSSILPHGLPTAMSTSTAI